LKSSEHQTFVFLLQSSVHWQFVACKFNVADVLFMEFSSNCHFFITESEQC